MPKESDLVWTTAFGVRVPVSFMTKGHVMNCLRMLRDHYYLDVDNIKWYPVFHQEAFKRGLVTVPPFEGRVPDIMELTLLNIEIDSFKQSDIRGEYAQSPHS